MAPSPGTEAYLPLSEPPAGSRDAGRPRIPIRTRARGAALSALGLGIAVTLSIGLAGNAPQMLEPGRMVDGGTFTGTAGQGRVAIILMIWALLTSVSFIAAGVQLWTSGRLGIWLKGLSAFLVATLVVAAWRLSSMLG